MRFEKNKELTLSYLKNYCQNNRLIDHNCDDFYRITKEYLNQIINLSTNKPIIFLVESNSLNFLAGFLASIMTNSSLFLVNYKWNKTEFQKLFELAKPDLILGNINYDFSGHITLNNANYLPNKIMIPTGGSSGKIKFAIHSWQSLSNSVRGFFEYFNEEKINSFCLLPLYHVSGLMQFLRSFLTEGNFKIASYQNLKHNNFTTNNFDNYFISLVPTQLQFLLENNPSWLRQFKTVLVGGAATNKILLIKAREEKINIALTYGMTETASAITILKPKIFLEGNNSNGQLLPHAEIFFTPNNSLNPQKNTRIINIKCSSLFEGYYPEKLNNNNYFVTDDLGYFDEQNYLYIMGRNSRKIISGGENIYPCEIEAVILATDLVQDIVIFGKKDLIWGEMAIAIYIPKSDQFSEQVMIDILKKSVSNYKIPKHWYAVNLIPRNAQGKINFEQIKKIIKE